MKQSIKIRLSSVMKPLLLCAVLASSATFAPGLSAADAKPAKKTRARTAQPAAQPADPSAASLGVVKKVYNLRSSSPSAVKNYVSSDFFNLYKKCSGGNFALGSVWGFGFLDNPKVASVTDTEVVVTGQVVNDNYTSNIKAILIKENGRWVINDIVFDGTTSAKAMMKDYLSKPHDGMLLSEVAKIDGVKWIVTDYGYSASGPCFSIKIEYTSPEGTFEYDTTADYATVYGTVASTGLTQKGIKGILAALKGKEIGEDIVIKVAPDYFNRDGVIVEEELGDF